MDKSIPDFHQKTIDDHISQDTAMTASLVNIGGRLQPVERSTRSVWDTDWLTNRQIDFIICPMLLMADQSKAAHCYKAHSEINRKWKTWPPVKS